MTKVANWISAAIFALFVAGIFFVADDISADSMFLTVQRCSL